MSVQPNHLQSGDQVVIIAPGGRVKDGGLDYAISKLSSWGLKVKVADHVWDGHQYFSASDEDRLSDLQNALNSTQYKAILCARGGYGLTKIIDKVDFSQLIAYPKWLIGFSDVTALHLAVSSVNIQSIHAIMPAGFELADPQSMEALRKVLFGEPLEINVEAKKHNRYGNVEAPIIGGNLSLLSATIGTKYEIATAGKILFIEEIDEYLYKIDRMFGQLSRSGKLANLKGLVVGHISQTKDTTIPFGMNIEQLILDHISSHNYPVLFDVPIGHEPLNFPIVQEEVYKLQVNSEGGLLKMLKIR